MYLTQSSGGAPQAIPSPSTTAGLYIYPRTKAGQPKPEAVKVAIPPDCLGKPLPSLLDSTVVAK
jgi:hypothetical protein